MHAALKWLILPIFILALIAAAAGLWPGDGTPYPLTTFRGEEATINARGLYYWDTVSSAAQMQANDLVMLALDLPPFVPLAYRNTTLTTCALGPNVDDTAVRKRLLDEYNIEISGGFGPLKGKVWRIGLMGHSSRRENVALLLAALSNLH